MQDPLTETPIGLREVESADQIVNQHPAELIETFMRESAGVESCMPENCRHLPPDLPFLNVGKEDPGLGAIQIRTGECRTHTPVQTIRLDKRTIELEVVRRMFPIYFKAQPTEEFVRRNGRLSQRGPGYWVL